uniref:Opioid receptor, mu 1 n=1 Tax=Oncorhynchus kisutch TaxID=8019 RepID=A0A8C7LAT7_ONCKI
MGSGGNTSDIPYYFSHLAMMNNSVFCRNFSDNVSVEAKCERTDNLAKDSTPVIIAIIITTLYSIVCVLGLVGNVLVMYVIIRIHRLHFDLPTPILVLGESPENLRLHLCLHHPGPHHYRMLRANDLAPEERAHVVRLQGEGPQPAAHHPHGPGGGGRLHHLLDAHPHLRHHQSPNQHPQLPAAVRHLALLHRSGLHQQLPESRPLRLPGRELQALLPRVLHPPESLCAGAAEFFSYPPPPAAPARSALQRQQGGEVQSTGMTRYGDVVFGLTLPA